MYSFRYAGFEGVIAVHMEAKWTRAIATGKAWAKDAKYSKAALEQCVSEMEDVLVSMGGAVGGAVGGTVGGAVSVASTVVASVASVEVASVEAEVAAAEGGEEKAGEEKEGEKAGEAKEEEKAAEAPVTVAKPAIKPACKWVVTKEGKWAKAEVVAAKAEETVEGNKAKAACTVA